MQLPLVDKGSRTFEKNLTDPLFMPQAFGAFRIGGGIEERKVDDQGLAAGGPDLYRRGYMAV